MITSLQVSETLEVTRGSDNPDGIKHGILKSL